MQNKTLILVAATILLAHTPNPCAAGGFETTTNTPSNTSHIQTGSTEYNHAHINRINALVLDANASLDTRMASVQQLGAIALNSGGHHDFDDIPSDAFAIAKFETTVKLLGRRKDSLDRNRQQVVASMVDQLLGIVAHFNEPDRELTSHDAQKINKALDGALRIFKSKVSNDIKTTVRTRIRDFAENGSPAVVEAAVLALQRVPD